MNFKRTYPVFSKIVLPSITLMLVIWLITTSSTLKINLDPPATNHSELSHKLSFNPPKPNKTLPTLSTVSTAKVNEQKNDQNEVYAEKHYIVDCAIEDIITEEDYEVYHQSANQFLQSLGNDNDKNKQLAYTLFAPLHEGKTRLDLLIEFNQRFSDTAIVLTDIVRLCTTLNYNAQCDSNLLQSAIAADSNNGAMWLQQIFLHLSNDNEPGILYAIDELLKSPYMEDSFVQKIELYLQSLNAYPTHNSNINTVAALFDYAFGEALTMNSYTPLFQWCKKSISDPLKTAVCLKLGNYLQKNSLLITDQIMGIELQKLVFEGQGNKQLLAEAQDSYNNIMATISSDKAAKASSLLMADERLLRSWLTNIKHYGEVVAQQLLVEEAILLSKNEHYSPCTRQR